MKAAAARQRQRQAAHGLQVAAQGIGQAHHDVEAAVALEHVPASRPPMAVAIVSCTSPTFRP
jgi:hypothetical protein